MDARLPRIELTETASANHSDAPADLPEEVLKKGELPTRFAPGVSRWMTWTCVALLFSIPLAQSALEMIQQVRPQVLSLFRRTPSRTNLHEFEKNLEENSFARRMVQARVHLLKGSADAGIPEDDSSQVSKLTGQQSPFIEWVRNKKGFALHPFIGYTEGQFVPDSDLDYFGFRNSNKRIYFDRPPGKLVVITGSSEILGVTHKHAIAQRLEEYLNKHGDEPWKVLNLGMNNYTLPFELNAYFHLAHHLHPEYVISHSFPLDAYYGLMMPPEFQALGFTYYKALEGWYLQARGFKPSDNAGSDIVGKAENQGVVVDAFLRTAQKFRDVVTANHGHYVLGVQGYMGLKGDTGQPPGTMRQTLTIVPALYTDLRAKLPSRNLDFIDFSAASNIVYADTFHTAEEPSAQIIAEMYGKHILQHAHGRGKYPVGKVEKQN